MRKEIPPLRESIVRDFKAILYPPPWYDAPLRFLDRITARNRKPDDEVGDDSDPS
jgi:hypothetical protein